MKKFVSFIIILMIVVVFVNYTTVNAQRINQQLVNPDNFAESDEELPVELKKSFSIVFQIISLVGSAISIIVLIIIGIKYMMGSVEEKAQYKETLLPYLIGAVCVFGAVNIANAIYKTTVPAVSEQKQATIIRNIEEIS